MASVKVQAGFRCQQLGTAIPMRAEKIHTCVFMLGSFVF